MKAGSKVFLLSAAVLSLAQQSQAISFAPVTNNDPGNAATVGQYQVVAGAGPVAGQIQFTFSNLGPVQSSITGIYFDDGALAGGVLLGIANIVNSAGVQFSEGASPPGLPGGNMIDFETHFSLDSDSPPPQNGINPGETLTIIFDLEAGVPLGVALDAYNSGAHLIGIHVQAFGNRGSETFVTTVPDGGSTAILIGIGVAALGFARRKLS